MTDEITNIIVKYFRAGDTLTPEERQTLQTWREASPENNQQFRYLQNITTQARELHALNDLDVAAAWQQLKQRKSHTKHRSIYAKNWYAVAATLLLLITAGILLYTQYSARDIEHLAQQQIYPGSTKAYIQLADGSTHELQSNTTQQIDYHGKATITKDSMNMLHVNLVELSEATAIQKIIVPRGGEFGFTLSDGTKVWLNALSELSYPLVFTGDKREVHVTGEAYFEVAKNEKKPFIVTSPKSRLEVLGTHFNYRAYGDEPMEQITLTEGKIKVARSNAKPFSNLSIDKHNYKIIVPGQQVQTKGDSLSVYEVNATLHTSWVHGILSFKNEPLYRIANDLSRWYQTDFVFEAESLKNKHFTGAVKKDRDIQYLLNLIEETTDVKFEIEGNIIKVKH